MADLLVDETAMFCTGSCLYL